MSSNIRIQRVCQHCNKAFEAQTTVTKFCSDRCAKYAYKKRIRDQKIEASNKETEAKLLLPVEKLKQHEFLTVDEAAKVLRVSRTTIYRLSQAGQLKLFKVIRKTIVRRSDLDDFLALNIIQPIVEAPIVKKIEPVDQSDLISFQQIIIDYGVSEKALYGIVERSGIERIKKRGANYVSHKAIEKIFGKPKNKPQHD